MLSSLARQAATLARRGGILALLVVATAGWAQQQPPTSPRKADSRSLLPIVRPRPGAATQTKHQNRITTMVINNKLTTFTFGSPVAFRTADPLGVYSGRPLLAVGDIVSVDPTSRTVVLAIRRDLSSLPHPLEVAAKKQGVYQKLLEREFPATRTFFVRRNTAILDPSLIKNNASRLETNRERLARQTIKLEDLRPGDRVSVNFRMSEDPATPPAVYNFSKQDPTRTHYEATYRALPIIRPAEASLTSRSMINDQPTSHPKLRDESKLKIREQRKAALEALRKKGAAQAQ